MLIGHVRCPLLVARMQSDTQRETGTAMNPRLPHDHCNC